MNLRGFMGFIALLFLASQVLCCFHTHDSLHEFDEVAPQQVDCDVCLIAGMPVDTGSDPAISISAPEREAASPRLVSVPPLALHASPNRARAPPHA